MSVADELQKLMQLKESGVLSESEFQVAKERLLHGGQSSAPAASVAVPLPQPAAPIARPPQPAQPSKLLDPKANAKAAVRIVAIIGAFIVGIWIFRAMVGGGGPVAQAGSALRGPQVLLDEELAISAGGSQMRGFSLPSTRPIQISVTGVKDTDKGYSVYVMKQSEWENFKNHNEFRHIPSFEGLKVRSITKTDTLPPGQYALVVHNSQNLLNSMVVHAKMVSDP